MALNRLSNRDGQFNEAQDSLLLGVHVEATGLAPAQVLQVFLSLNMGAQGERTTPSAGNDPFAHPKNARSKRGMKELQWLDSSMFTGVLVEYSTPVRQ